MQTLIHFAKVAFNNLGQIIVEELNQNVHQFNLILYSTIQRIPTSLGTGVYNFYFTLQMNSLSTNHFYSESVGNFAPLYLNLSTSFGLEVHTFNERRDLASTFLVYAVTEIDHIYIV
jgi:hypothetical protein